MANCFQSLGQFALAITNIQIAIDIEPRAQFYANLSEYLRQAKQYEEAVDAAETAITIDSQFALAYRALGNVYFELGDYLNAAYNYQLVVLYDPGEMSAWYNLGVAYSEMGELDEAVMALEVVVTEGHDSPEYISSLNNLAYLYIDKLEAHYDRAIELAETALALIEDDTQRGYVLDTIAWGFFKSGDCAQANVLILEAVELVRDNPEIQDHLAIIESDCES